MTELAIPLVSSVELGTSSVIAHVEIGRRDHWRTVGSGVGRELSVSSAWLRGVVVHKGLRYAYICCSTQQRANSCPEEF